MITVTNSKNCCGCGGCAQVCRLGAIQMLPDKEGFSYPHVNRDRCVDCGQCEGVCPIVNAGASSDNVSVRTYVSYAEDAETRLESSSGGLFSVLARAALEGGAQVFGAAFAEDFSVSHIGIRTSEDLKKLRGSKYVQSDIGNCFRQAKQALDAGQSVLFSGTACQIAGLKQYLGRDYAHLLTVDVLCHGVPSPKAWKSYIHQMQTKFGAPMTYANFRSKDTGWMRFSMKLEFANGQSACTPFPDDNYMKAFLRNYSLRPSCYACRFKGMNRPSDITLGDCWDIAKVDESMHDDRGTSVVIVRTPKGQAALDAVKGDLILKEAELSKALPPAADSRRSVVPHPRRKAFFRRLTETRFPVIKDDTRWDARRILLVKIYRKLLRMAKR